MAPQWTLKLLRPARSSTSPPSAASPSTSDSGSHHRSHSQPPEIPPNTFDNNLKVPCAAFISIILSKALETYINTFGEELCTDNAKKQETLLSYQIRRLQVQHFAVLLLTQ